MVSLFFGDAYIKKKSENTCSFEIVTFLKFKIDRMHLLEIFLDILSFYHLFFKKKRHIISVLAKKKQKN